jgi:hypothetical protein
MIVSPDPLEISALFQPFCPRLSYAGNIRQGRA